METFFSLYTSTEKQGKERVQVLYRVATNLKKTKLSMWCTRRIETAAKLFTCLSAASIWAGFKIYLDSNYKFNFFCISFSLIDCDWLWNLSCLPCKIKKKVWQISHYIWIYNLFIISLIESHHIIFSKI